MGNCVSCSAPLPASSTICAYCNRRNDVDFHGINHHTTNTPESERNCPCCHKPMRTINLKTDGKFLIERCEQCMGLFFDTGELEAILENSVSNVFHINQQRINTINKELFQEDTQRASFYIKCPVCNDMMHRKNYANSSGVIADYCKKHGVWLSGGELKQLMEWKKAGGQMLHEKITVEKSLEEKINRMEAKINTNSKNKRNDYNEDPVTAIVDFFGGLF
ncbi:MAG: zf-TFIIB domain-containing protein [Gammaproteobacteria bacterium]|nr:zf-TFIIB domain-containing protein [Gammaproteobacteria bacterium]